MAATPLTGDEPVRRTDVDGVPVFWADVPGPLRAGLLFRVGQADETAVRRGVTHLVEHLALSGLGQSPHAYNGATGRTTTTFVTVGPADDVARHLTGVCDALRRLPLDRLDHEVRVLRSEASTVGPAPLASWRWGPQGYGLVGYEELGLRHLTGEQAQAWAAERFTRAGAALWLSGPPPAGLRLDLPDGVPPPAPPDPYDAVIPVPSWFSTPEDGVQLSYLAPRTAVGPLLLAVLLERLQARLRHERALVYGVLAGLDRLTATTAEHRLATTGRAEQPQQLVDELCAVLADVLERGVTDDEVRAAALHDEAGAASDDAAVGTAAAHALAAVLGGSAPASPAALVRETAALSGADVAAAARDGLRSLLLAVPFGTEVPASLAERAPAWSATTLSGAAVLPTAHHPDKQQLTRLVLAEEGLSLCVHPDRAATVRFEDVVSLVPYSDGSRSLLSKEGHVLGLFSEQWHEMPRVTRAVDEGVDPAVRLPLVPRTPPDDGRSLLTRTWRGRTWRARLTQAACVAAGLGALARLLG